ncbi:MAG: ABC transporter ATP-binding protein [Acidobacteriota bacterium]
MTTAGSRIMKTPSAPSQINQELVHEPSGRAVTSSIDGSSNDPVQDEWPRTSRQNEEALLELHELEVHYGDVVAVAGAQLNVFEGEFLALLGPSGCGKTSLLRTIAGFEDPAAGSIRLGGREIASLRKSVPPEKRRVGMVFQHGALFPHMTVLDNVLYGIDADRDRRETALNALELVGLGRLAKRYPDELSGGQQQRVALARALAPSPSIVLLDEPFANLDASLRGRVREQVREILQRAGATAVLVTHDQEEALSLADRIAVMREGQVLQVGPPEQVYHYPETLEVATFIGEGQLLDCEVSQGMVRCAYGVAFSDAEDGPGRLFVRPEDLAIMPQGHSEGIRGQVYRRRFFGHDLLTEVRTETDETLHVRELSSDSSTPGTPIKVCLRKKAFRVFAPEAV